MPSKSQKEAFLKQKEFCQKFDDQQSQPVAKTWTMTENRDYVKFLKQNETSFLKNINRRTSKIFVEMSMCLEVKTPSQCRSHHQKVVKRYKNVKNIIRNFMNDQKIHKINKTEAQKKSNCSKTFLKIQNQGLIIERKSTSTLKICFDPLMFEIW